MGRKETQERKRAKNAAYALKHRNQEAASTSSEGGLMVLDSVITPEVTENRIQLPSTSTAADVSSSVPRKRSKGRPPKNGSSTVVTLSLPTPTLSRRNSNDVQQDPLNSPAVRRSRLGSRAQSYVAQHIDSPETIERRRIRSSERQRKSRQNRSPEDAATQSRRRQRKAELERQRVHNLSDEEARARRERRNQLERERRRTRSSEQVQMDSARRSFLERDRRGRRYASDQTLNQLVTDGIVDTRDTSLPTPIPTTSVQVRQSRSRRQRVESSAATSDNRVDFDSQVHLDVPMNEIEDNPETASNDVPMQETPAPQLIISLIPARRQSITTPMMDIDEEVFVRPTTPRPSTPARRSRSRQRRSVTPVETLQVPRRNPRRACIQPAVVEEVEAPESQGISIRVRALQGVATRMRRLFDRNRRHITDVRAAYSLFRRDGVAQIDDNPYIYDEEVYAQHTLGEKVHICTGCNASHWKYETNQHGTYFDCCDHGRHKQQETPEYPEFLQRKLMDKRGNVSKNLRHYNNAFSMVSLGTNIEHPPGFGPSVFRIRGMMYHHVPGYLTRQQPSDSRFAQIYILDNEQDVIEAHQGYNSNLTDTAFITECFNWLRSNNMYVIDLKTNYDILLDQEEAAERTGMQLPNIFLSFNPNFNPRIHPGRQNEPTMPNMVFMLTSNDVDGQIPEHRDFRIYPRRISEEINMRQKYALSTKSMHVMPMTYPILNPHGIPGWHPEFFPVPYPNFEPRVPAKRLSCRQYYMSLLAERRSEFNPYLNADSLTQQVIVDMQAFIEQDRINYIRTHQEDLGAERYDAVQNAVTNQAQRDNADISSIVILPSTFEGSPRNMREKCRDTMAIFAEVGHPDLFITFTANPNWPEIKAHLLPGQSSVSRPDIVDEVFKGKLDAFYNLLWKQEFFGKPRALVVVIEYQKRGLPHAHMLLALDPAARIQSTDFIDRYISAELPNAEQNPRLYEIISRSMIHGPCLPSRCLDSHGRCKKGFPKPFNDDTRVNRAGFPEYRRRFNRDTTTHRGAHRQQFTFNNRWVVPHNPALCLIFDAHINVEACTSMQAIMYIYKYMFKGYDIANMIVTVDGQISYNEPNNYLAGRVLTATEAYWRIRGYPSQFRTHSVVRLPIHLEGERQHTELNEFFNMNDRLNLSHKYVDFPKFYIWNDQQHQWVERTARQRKPIVGRIHPAGPTNIELFALRALLLHVAGPKSFQHLRFVNGEQYETFHAAAQSYGLMMDDEIWIETFRNLTQMHLANELRYLLVNMCVNGIINDASRIWDEFWEAFTVDIRRRRPHINDDNVYKQMALNAINDLFRLRGKTAADYHLPMPNSNFQAPPIEELDPVPELQQPSINLNSEQERGYDLIMDALQQRSVANVDAQRLFFVVGPGGSGKTTLYRKIIAELQRQNKGVIALATTGIAATLMDNGQTVHSGFSLPVPLYDHSRSYMRPNDAKYQKIQSASVVIIDEITMLSKHALNIIDEMLRDMEDPVSLYRDTPFGGKIIVVGGDFRQLLPVVPQGQASQIIEASVLRTEHWHLFRPIILSQNMRAIDNNEAHIQWLLDMGVGKLLNNVQLPANIIEIPQQMLLHIPNVSEIPEEQLEDAAIDAMIDEIFGQDIHLMLPAELSKRAILTTTVADMLKINDRIHMRVGNNTTCQIYHSTDEAVTTNESDRQNYSMEYLNRMMPSGLPPHTLKLSIGAIIMLIRNLDTTHGLCNGTRLIVTNLLPNAIVANIVSSDRFNSRTIFIPRMTLMANDETTPFQLKRLQFPVLPAFAMTINKSQGQTFERVGIYLNDPVFAHGQLYVAFSRCRSRDNTTVYVRNLGMRQGNLNNDHRVYTRNVVYRQVFQHGELEEQQRLSRLTAAEQREVEQIRQLIANTALPDNFNDVIAQPDQGNDEQVIVVNEPSLDNLPDHERGGFVNCDSDDDEFEPVEMPPHEVILPPADDRELLCDDFDRVFSQLSRTLSEEYRMGDEIRRQTMDIDIDDPGHDGLSQSYLRELEAYCDNEELVAQQYYDNLQAKCDTSIVPQQTRKEQPLRIYSPPPGFRRTDYETSDDEDDFYYPEVPRDTRSKGSEPGTSF